MANRRSWLLSCWPQVRQGGGEGNLPCAGDGAGSRVAGCSGAPAACCQARTAACCRGRSASCWSQVVGRRDFALQSEGSGRRSQALWATDVTTDSKVHTHASTHQPQGPTVRFSSWSPNAVPGSVVPGWRGALAVALRRSAQVVPLRFSWCILVGSVVQ
eukprot:13418772-Alexandrium_andersonii.AAC.1